MEARLPISAAANYEVDKSSSQRNTEVVYLLPDCACRSQLTEALGLTVIRTEETLPVVSDEAQTTLHKQPYEDEDEEDMLEYESQAEPVKILKEEANFDAITVWGHDRLPAADDSFLKGIEEWVAFAEAVCISQQQPFVG